MISMMKKTSQKKALARMTGLGFEAGEDGEGKCCCGNARTSGLLTVCLGFTRKTLTLGPCT